MTEPAEAAAPLAVADAREMLAHTNLVDVVFLVFNGSRRPDGSEPPETSEPVLNVVERHSEDRIEVEVGLTLTTEHATFDISAAARYTLTSPLELRIEVVKEFIERVAVMAVFPYLREGVSSMASRLRVPVPTIGILPAGGMQLEQISRTDRP